MRVFYIEYTVLGKTHIDYIDAMTSIEVRRILDKKHKGHFLTVKRLKILANKKVGGRK